MTKIAMIGAGSTVFMKNLVGDILSEPLLRECEIALMDIDPKRLATSKAVAERIAAAVEAQAEDQRHHGSPARAGRRRLRRPDDPGRRLQARHRHRLRDPQATRAAPDHRRYARHRRHHARASHGAGAGRHRPRHGRALPQRADAAIRQPDGDQLCRAVQAGASRYARSGFAIRCKAPPRNWRPISACRQRRSATSAPASTTWPSI